MVNWPEFKDGIRAFHIYTCMTDDDCDSADSKWLYRYFGRGVFEMMDKDDNGKF